MSGATPPPGWYQDPGNPSGERYWDGVNWSNETRTPNPTLPPPGGGAMGNGMSPAMYSGQPPESYLVWAILATLFCCWPLGIPSIVYAVKVNKLWMQGQQEAAYEASKNAKKWAIISAVSAGAFLVLIFLFTLLTGL